MKIETRITIQATKKQIWDVLMDFQEYPNWNPFISHIEGQAVIGMPLFIQLPTMSFKPIVFSNRKERYFSWKGKLLCKGIFDGHHCFKIKQINEVQCEFYHSEEFSGILVPFLKKKLQTETLAGFIAMNKALKEQVEKLHL